MKKLLFIALCMFVVVSCEDALDKAPLDIISEQNVWQDESLVDLYIADLYNKGNFFHRNGAHHYDLAEVVGGGLSRSFGSWQFAYQTTLKPLTPDDDDNLAPLHFWAYDAVRQINFVIEKLSDENSPFDADYRNTRLGECYWLRAWIYFKMVRLYGGVPIIDRVQSLDEPDEDLFVPRSSEEETYDFVAADCDRARNLLMDKNLTEYGRATEWAALALKSRAMLYAASIGEFGEVQTIGFGELETTLGISDPDKYWNLSFQASKEIIDNGPFSLFEKLNPDYVKNFEELFQAEEEANPEVIFSERFNGWPNGRGHNWDLWNQPDEFRNCCGNLVKVFRHTLEYFEYKDGSSGVMDPADYVPGDPNNLHSLEEWWLNRDPRAYASIFTAELPWKGSIVYTHVGTYKLDENNERQYITDGEVTDGIRTVPASGRFRDLSRSALNLKKRLTEELYMTQNEVGLSYTDFIVFRLAEIYLNYAEADFYLNDGGTDGLSYLNLVRQRVGMPDKTSLTQDLVRDERTRELMFEHHHIWDIIRWRIAEEELHGKEFEGIEMKYDFDEDKYEITFVSEGPNNGDVSPRFFSPHNYYYPISTSRIYANPALVQNPGYIQ